MYAYRLAVLWAITTSIACANTATSSFQGFIGYTTDESFPTVDGAYYSGNLNYRYRLYSARALVTVGSDENPDLTIANIGINGRDMTLTAGRIYSGLCGLNKPLTDPTDDTENPPARAVLLGKACDALGKSEIGASLEFRDGPVTLGVAAYQPQATSVQNVLALSVAAGTPIEELVSALAESLRGLDILGLEQALTDAFFTNQTVTTTGQDRALFFNVELDASPVIARFTQAEITLQGVDLRILNLGVEYFDVDNTVGFEAVDLGDTHVFGLSWVYEWQRLSYLIAGSLVRGELNGTEYSTGLGYRRGQFVGQLVYRNARGQANPLRPETQRTSAVELSGKWRFSLQ